MKARVKATGKIVDVVESIGGGAYVDETGETYYVGQIELLGDMPSENRMRYELSKAAMQGILSNLCGSINREEIVKVAIKCADEMIRQLKESEVENESGNY